jgi:hypothetical protein
MEITKENLITFGMKETEGDEKMIFPMKKVISIQNEDADEDEGDLAICVTQMRNASELCLMLPDGACIYLDVQSIEDLQTFEKCIASYEPNY